MLIKRFFRLFKRSLPVLPVPGQIVVEVRGLEPLTSGLQSPRSAKLSYTPFSSLCPRQPYQLSSALTRCRVL